MSAVGITAVGFYLPRYRLDRQKVGQVWGRQYLPGTRSLANHDEDSLTMAAEAVWDCLKATDPAGVGGLIFVSSSSPYAEKQVSTVLCNLIELGSATATLDCGASVRGTSGALQFALPMAAGAKPVLVVAADTRDAEPGSELEQVSGDGAAAVLLGHGDPIAIIEAAHSHAEDFTDIWRRSTDRFVRTDEPPVLRNLGYIRCLRACLEGLWRQGYAAGAFSRVVLSIPEPGRAARVARELGLPTPVYPSADLLNTVGDTGAAAPLLALILALEEAQPGDKVLMCTYSSGNADAFVFHVTERVRSLQAGLRDTLGSVLYREVPDYQRFLEFRRLIPREQTQPFTSNPMLWRDRKQNLGLYATRCRQCADLAYPRRRVCLGCGAKDDFDDVKLSRQGTIFTYTEDHLFPTPDPPMVMGIADLKGGGRFYGQVTDCGPGQLQIGQPVRLVFRKLHEGGDFHNYFWKLSPW